MTSSPVSSNVTKQIKDVSFFHGAKAEFPKFKRNLITLAKQHGLFRVFIEDVEIPVADEEKSVDEIQAGDTVCFGFSSRMLKYLSLMKRNQSTRFRQWVSPKMKFENTF